MGSVESAHGLFCRLLNRLQPQLGPLGATNVGSHGRHDVWCGKMTDLDARFGTQWFQLSPTWMSQEVLVGYNLRK